MSYPIKADVQRVLARYHSRIRRVVQRAWDEWRAVDGFRADSAYDPVLYSRTVANYMFDAIARYAIAEFASDATVHVKIEAQTVKFVFEGKVIGRFKKGDDNRLGQNIVTGAVSLFLDAEESLPGFPASTAKVEFIWLANDLFTRLEQVLVVARDNDRLIWEYEIEPTEEAGATVITFPAAIAETDHDTEELVKPKLTDAQEQEKE